MLKSHLKKTNDDLLIDGVSAKEITAKYGTPLYVYSANSILKQYRRLRDAFKNAIGEDNFQICYAVKANSNLSILKLLQSEGCGADCSCLVEIEYAKAAGFTSDKSLFTSINPDDNDLQSAWDAGYFMNLDDVSIFPQLPGVPEFISFRVNPGVGAGKFTQIIVGGEGTKFGMNEEKAIEAYHQAKEAGVKKFGMHMMTGSCILNADYFLQITEKILEIASDISKAVGIDFEYIDIGGGFGIPYEEGESELDVEAMATSLSKLFVEKSKELDLKQPKLFMEPGRYIVGESGIVLSKVNQIKDEKELTFLGLDAGMTTLMRPALYGAYHHVEAVKKSGSEKNYKIVGPICESTDCLAESRKLPELERGDLVAICDTGAYGFAMSNNFNGRLRPAEILVENGECRLIRKADSVKDELSKQNDF